MKKEKERAKKERVRRYVVEDHRLRRKKKKISPREMQGDVLIQTRTNAHTQVTPKERATNTAKTERENKNEILSKIKSHDQHKRKSRKRKRRARKEESKAEQHIYI
jgi:hypothetical protein